jgi:D-3-phosphoglycerate dehydrogenase
MDRPLIIVPDPVHEATIERLNPHFRVITHDAFERDRQSAFENADAALVRAFKMPREILELCPRLKVIAKHGAGIDSIDMPTASRLGIAVANVPGGNASAVAEATVALMMGAIWRTPLTHKFVKTGQFERRWELQFEQLTDRVLGVVGLGNIGRLVARICAGGFNMKILAYDPFVKADAMEVLGIQKVEDLDHLLRESDIVSLHIPITDDNYHLIGRQQLKLMKKTAVLVNAARGKLVDSAALCEALEEGWIAGAGLDVFEVEPPSADDPLLHAPNLVMAPHSASKTIKAERGIGLASANIAIDVLAGRQPRNFVNPEIWPSRRT